MKMRVHLIAAILMLVLALPAGAFQANGGGGGGGGGGTAITSCTGSLTNCTQTGAVLAATVPGAGCTLSSFPVSGCTDQAGVCTICTISSAQLLAFDGTGAHAIPSIPAQGAGTVFELTGARAEFLAGTTPYVAGTYIDYFFQGQTVGVGATDIINKTGGMLVDGTIGNLWWVLNPGVLYFGQVGLSSTGYLNPLSTIANKAMMLDFGNSNHYVQTGPITSASLDAGATPSGYLVGDTGIIDIPIPGDIPPSQSQCSSADATYVITAVGPPVTFTVTSPGSYYALTSSSCNGSTPYSTQNGGAQPGVGTGLTIDVNSATLTGSNGTIRMRFFYNNATVQ